MKRWRDNVFRWGLAGVFGFSLLAIASMPFMGTTSGAIAAIVAGIATGICGFGLLLFLGPSVGRLPRLIRMLGDPSRYELAFNQLIDMKENAVPMLIQALNIPRGAMRQGREYFDGDTARCLAVEALGRLRAREGVESLAALLYHPDPILQANATMALGKIGDSKAIQFLLPLLGNDTIVPDDIPDRMLRKLSGTVKVEEVSRRILSGIALRRLSDLAANALAQLGEEKLVDDFSLILQNDSAALERMKEKYPRECAVALIQVLDSNDVSRVCGAVWALGELGSVEGYRRMAKLILRHRGSPEFIAAVQAAMVKFDGRMRLPRSADEEVSKTQELPRAANPDPTLSVQTFPRQAMNKQ